LGTVKPWHHTYGPTGLQFNATSAHQLGHVAHWWRVFTEDVQNSLKPEYAPSTIGRSDGPPVVGSSESHPTGLVATGPSDAERQRAWESGHPDYLGRDSFDNIQKALEEAMK